MSAHEKGGRGTEIRKGRAGGEGETEGKRGRGVGEQRDRECARASASVRALRVRSRAPAARPHHGPHDVEAALRRPNRNRRLGARRAGRRTNKRRDGQSRVRAHGRASPPGRQADEDATSTDAGARQA